MRISNLKDVLVSGIMWTCLFVFIACIMNIKGVTTVAYYFLLIVYLLIQFFNVKRLTILEISDSIFTLSPLIGRSSEFDNRTVGFYFFSGTAKTSFLGDSIVFKNSNRVLFSIRLNYLEENKKSLTSFLLKTGLVKLRDI